ncbi:MAG: hypothetical protein DLM69_06085 [Candidatus Chloroheliales bacterium]|nr:MAG: hypothetical protein DLM69_06085 [Chloroflexota bacterium]
MAKMYPEHIAEDTASWAERVLYDTLRDRLPAEFTVMHSVRWVMRGQRRLSDGEADFLIVHPRLGLLVVEVKGGDISCRGGEWFSSDRSGGVHQIKNPFAQASGNKYKLLDKLADSPATSRFHSLYLQRIGHAVAFPDTLVGSEALGLDGDRSLIFDSHDLFNIEAAVRRAMAHTDHSYALPAESLKALVDTVAPTRKLPPVGLAAAIIREGAEMSQLTEQQFIVISLLSGVREATIGGCAGSGKTMIAMEKARRLADEGFRVLLVTFNRPIADDIEARFKAGGVELGERIKVKNYTNLVRSICYHAGLKLPSEKDIPAEGRQHFYNEVMPEYLLQAADLLPDYRFDAIIVDEGQDFLDLWFDTLHSLLADPQGVFYVFYDDNQRIYGSEHTSLARRQGQPFTLSTNCRNTKRIHQLVTRYYRGQSRLDALGPEGREPSVHQFASGGELEALRHMVNELVGTQGIAASDIVVLTAASAERSMYNEGTRLGNLTLTWKPRAAANQLRVSTIHRFKGLESAIVILVELDKAHSQGAERDYLMYVATSRARHELIILGELPPPDNSQTLVSPTTLLHIEE